MVFWLIVAVIAFIIELLSIQFFMFWLGVGAVAALISHLVGVDYNYQLVIFLVIAVIGIALTRSFAKSILKEEPKKSCAPSLVGEEMRVIQTIDNFKGTGQVERKGEVWSAKSAEDTIIEKGSCVRVKYIEGVYLAVKLIKERGEKMKNEKMKKEVKK